MQTLCAPHDDGLPARAHRTLGTARRLPPSTRPPALLRGAAEEAASSDAAGSPPPPATHTHTHPVTALSLRWPVPRRTGEGTLVFPCVRTQARL